MAGGGKSTQQSNPVYTDNRAVLGEGSIYANNGANVATSNYVLDGGAIGGAIDLAKNAVESNNQQGQYLYSRATDFADATNAKAFDFGSDALSGAISGISNAVRQALNFSSDAQSGAFDAFSEALEYSAKNTDRALDNLASTQQLTADAYNDAKGRGAMTDKILMGAIAAMAVVAFMAVKK